MSSLIISKIFVCSTYDLFYVPRHWHILNLRYRGAAIGIQDIISVHHAQGGGGDYFPLFLLPPPPHPLTFTHYPPLPPPCGSPPPPYLNIISCHAPFPGAQAISPAHSQFNRHTQLTESLICLQYVLNTRTSYHGQNKVSYSPPPPFYMVFHRIARSRLLSSLHATSASFL